MLPDRNMPEYDERNERFAVEETEQQTKIIFQAISDRIRENRKQQGLTMEDLAKKAGFTKSYLSQIENTKREPTIGTLVTIANALGISIFSLIGSDGSEDADPIIVKADERRRVGIPSSTSLGNTLESVNFRKKDRLMDAYVLTSSPDFSEKVRAHEGEELIFILEGKTEFIYDGKIYLLEEGDCCSFDARKPHQGRSIGDKPSKSLIVFTHRRNDSLPLV
jgi:transcriptional regulator with XRE-family HTH domain